MKRPTFLALAAALLLLVLSVVHLTCAPSRGTPMEPQAESANDKPAPEHTNRLIDEQSPYLLQHAHNPVDWYPWGDAAFEKARKEDKPIFLSIGYSTCHWCHVMERESFEDEEVAALMNDAFVSIKVDREERPDIDDVYMTVCQMMTGQGGWPLTILMTPDRKPFYAATYIPKTSRFGRPGMVEFIPRVKELWETQRDQLVAQGEKVTDALASVSVGTAGEAPGPEELAAAYNTLSGQFDEEHGGFGSAPKFPTPHQLRLLLRHWRRTDEKRALAMVEATLRAMRLGGVYDHVGFGFHRYATDREWLVPHFEKMLYDQALLTLAYIEAYQATGDNFYARTAREICTYVLRDMQAPWGGFYSAEDADAEGVEGKFHVWHRGQLRAALDGDEMDFVVRVFNVRKEGNFRDESTGRKTGANILHLTEPLDEEARARWQPIRRKLFAAREQRVHPHKDDKVLADWNGLMIAGLARAGAVLGEEAFTQAAVRAADGILKHMRDADGRLLHRRRGGEAGIRGFLDDHAFLAYGLIDLYAATFDARRLREALDLVDAMREHFRDDENGGFFFTADDAEDLLVRKKEVYDGAAPSGNSVALIVLLKLARLTGRPELEAQADHLLKAFAGNVRNAPAGMTQMLIGVDFAVGPSVEVVIAGAPEAEDTARLLRVLREAYVPKHVLLLHPAGNAAAIEAIAPFTTNQRPVEGAAAAYVCRNHACRRPVTDPVALRDALGVAKVPNQ